MHGYGQDFSAAGLANAGDIENDESDGEDERLYGNAGKACGSWRITLVDGGNSWFLSDGGGDKAGCPAAVRL